MARRIRSIKPELLEDERTAGLSDTAFRLFIGLIVMADDFGNFRAAINFIEGQIYWLAIPEKAVDVSLQEIVDTGMIRLYAVRGQVYGTFTNWARHQRIDNASKARSLPSPDEADGDVSPRPAANRREVLTQPELSPRSRVPDPAAGREGIGMEGIGSGVGLDPPARTHTRAEEIPPPADDPGASGEHRPSGAMRITPAVEQNRPENRSAAPPPASPPSKQSESGYDLARRIWDELWTKRHRGRYQYPVDTGPNSDDRVLQDLGRLAIDSHGSEAEALLRHRMDGYLRDKGDRGWLEENQHPLRAIRKSWNKYGEPKKQQLLSNVRKHPSSPPAAPVGMNRMADLAAMVAGIGKVGMS